MRAGIYLRISQDRSGEELGVARQDEDCRALVARRGWTLERVYVDNDVSAKGHKVRPAWEEMMADVEAGRLDVVVGWTVDRTLRSGRDRLRMLEVGKERGLLITLARGSDMDLSTPAGRLAADILGAVALNEIETKADRQRRAHLQAAQQGRRIGGRRPFGFEQDGVTIREDEADAVREAFRDYLLGTPLSRIAARWNEAGLTSGVPRKDGTERWEHAGVRWLFRNPRYMGVRRHKPEGKPAELHPAAWPALVDEGTWRAVNAQLDSVASTFKPKAGRQLLTGIIRCAVCDENLVGGGKRKADGPGPMYRCPSGGHVTRRGEAIENLVLLLTRARLAQRDITAAVAERETAAPGRDLAAEATDLRTELETIALERAQRKITPRQFAILNDELQGQLIEVERLMTAGGRADAVAAILATGDPVARFDDLDRDQQRVIIGSLMRIRLHSSGRGRVDVVVDGVRLPKDPTTVEVEKLRSRG